MKAIQKHNFETIKKITPDLSSSLINSRIKNISWPVGLFPHTCEIKITNRCNLNCIFCYEDKTIKDEPDIKTIAKTLIKSRNEGAWICVIIGGEATLRKDITTIARLAKKSGYPCIKICTNAQTLSDERYLCKLMDCGFNMFDITLMSTKKDIHDHLVGVKGAYDRLITAFNNLKKNRCEIGINTVINRLNYTDFPNLINFTYHRLKVNYYNIIFGHYDGEFAKNIENLSINYTTVKPYIKKGLEIIRKTRFPVFSRILVNFPPCIFPYYLNIIADWEVEKIPKENILINSNIKKLYSIRENIFTKTHRCLKCILNSRCKGIDKRYLSIYGDSEIKPIKKKIKKFHFKTTFL